MTASEIIKTELTESGRTQVWLVRKINEAGVKMNKQRLSGVLNGKLVLSADEFLLMCKILNISAAERS